MPGRIRNLACFLSPPEIPSSPPFLHSVTAKGAFQFWGNLSNGALAE